jgi:hypothetical protein
MKLDLIVERYVQLRDKKAQMKAAYEASVADITTGMNRLENAILATLNEQGAESFRTAHGTAYKSTSTSATVADWDSLLGFVRENDRWDMLEKRVSKTAVDQFRAANDDLPPGINYRESVSVGVRRS